MHSIQSYSLRLQSYNIGYIMLKSYNTSVKLASELGKITFYTGKPKPTPGDVPTFEGF